MAFRGLAFPSVQTSYSFQTCFESCWDLSWYDEILLIACIVLFQDPWLEVEVEIGLGSRPFEGQQGLGPWLVEIQATVR